RPFTSLENRHLVTRKLLGRTRRFGVFILSRTDARNRLDSKPASNANCGKQMVRLTRRLSIDLQGVGKSFFAYQQQPQSRASAQHEDTDLSHRSVACFNGHHPLGQAVDVDWKVFGGASVSGPEKCFYDAEGGVRTERGLVRVWTKCLSQQDLEKIDVQHDFNGRIVESAARKTDNGYVPPIARIEDGIDLNKATVITRYEETANIAPIQPRASIFYELN